MRVDLMERWDCLRSSWNFNRSFSFHDLFFAFLCQRSFFSYKALEVSGKPRLSMSAVNSLFRDILVNGFKDAVPQETPILLYCSGSMGLGKCSFCFEDMVHHLIPVCILVEMNLSALFVLMKWLKGSTTDIKMVNAADAWACGTTDYFIWTGEH